MATWRALERRRSGLIKPSSASDRLRILRLSCMALNVDTEIKSPHRGPIKWLDVDCTEERYLLTGGADCTIALFDLEGPTGRRDTPDRGGPSRVSHLYGPNRTTSTRKQRPRELREVGRTSRTPLSQSVSETTSYGGHRHSVSVVRWYPVDNGLFMSGGMDGVVKLWDTNVLDVALEFDFKSKVFAADMPTTPGQQYLVAVGTDDPEVRLGDVRSGAFSHALTGHSEAVWACAWSPRSEYMLATGSADQTARLWDIRRSGASACLISLDQHRDEEEHEGSGSGYLQHRKLAPQVSRASNFSRAHAGPVNSMCFSPDGLHLLTAGTDNRLRLWEVEKGRNTMMNYLGTKNKRRRPFGMAVAHPAGRRSESVFFPNDTSGDVLVFPLHSADGKPKGQLRGHFDPVQCCAYRSRSQELITCSTDGLVLLWSAPVNGNGRAGATRASYLGLGHRGHDDLGDEDAWSSDEDEKRRTGSTLLGSGADANKTNSPTASTAGRGGGREGFVPPILMQERRYGSGGRGR